VTCGLGSPVALHTNKDVPLIFTKAYVMTGNVPEKKKIHKTVNSKKERHLEFHD